MSNGASAAGVAADSSSSVHEAALQKTAPVATSSSTPAPELTPAERLEASRARLRGALLEIAHPTPAPRAESRVKGVKDKLLDIFRDVPGITLLTDSIETWWTQHPLRAAGEVALQASEEFIVPMARRNPFMLLAGAVVIGALLVASRPWRWLLRPALFIGLVPQLVSHVLRRIPLDTWVRMGLRQMNVRPRARPSTPSATSRPVASSRSS